jgi:ribosomal protein S18 acetylase RimI-like enzyme
MPDPASVRIAPARWPDDLAAVGELFREYVDSLGVDLSFQDVTAEFAGLPGKYAPPGGTVLIARDAAGGAAGCVALRPAGADGACEMKRLYVRPSQRGTALGRRLAEAVIAHARACGYRRMLLDTLGTMRAALGLYVSLGFTPTAPYYDNPLPDTRYLARDL